MVSHDYVRWPCIIGQVYLSIVNVQVYWSNDLFFLINGQVRLFYLQEATPFCLGLRCECLIVPHWFDCYHVILACRLLPHSRRDTPFPLPSTCRWPRYQDSCGMVWPFSLELKYSNTFGRSLFNDKSSLYGKMVHRLISSSLQIKMFVILYHTIKITCFFLNQQMHCSPFWTRKCSAWHKYTLKCI